MESEITGLKLLKNDLRELASKDLSNEFLLGLFEVCAALYYWSLGCSEREMMFYMQCPTWRLYGNPNYFF